MRGRLMLCILAYWYLCARPMIHGDRGASSEVDIRCGRDLSVEVKEAVSVQIYCCVEYEE